MTEEDLLHGETYRDRISTVTKDGLRNWIYALKPSGQWYNYRSILAYTYLLVFFLLPLITVNGMPFMMFNVLEGKFILFSKIFWPQDFHIFAMAMIMFIIFIVLFTVVYGRLFCGWVCPQTVFLEFVFRPIEWLIEGSPNQQRKLDSSEYSAQKLLKKTFKHSIYLIISFVIAHTFLSYILGFDDVVKIIKEPISEHKSLLAGMIIFTLLFYAVFAFVREIVCTTICPYGRLQGVMVDKDSIQISYDYVRGEPRERFKKDVVRTSGDCVSCMKCVHVCPTGIDIRDGVQMECVGCTACVDACDDVMTSLHMKTGLIRYASENEIKTGVRNRFNARAKAYIVLLGVLTVVMAFLISSIMSVDTYISRASGQLYQTLPDGKISNLYESKIINKTRDTLHYDLRLEGIKGNIRWIEYKDIILSPENVNKYNFFIDLDPQILAGYSTKINLGVYVGDKKFQTISTNFLGPFK